VATDAGGTPADEGDATDAEAGESTAPATETGLPLSA